jgi:ankyrin repeat domain-containing protein 13
MENIDCSRGSADWDWTMDEFALIMNDSTIEQPCPSPTKPRSENNLFDTLILKSLPHIYFSKDLEEIISTYDYYLHYLIYTCQIASLSQFLHLCPSNLHEILNTIDHKGHSPLFLAVKLCERSREYLSIVRMLIEHGADIHKKDNNGWTMIDEAVSQKNRELVSVLFEYLYIEKLISWEKSRCTAQQFLGALPDFYVEIKWEFNSNIIPLVSKIGPHDTCKIWKIGGKLRFDTTLVGWKNFRSKRRNVSLVFNEELFIVNHSKKMVINPLEELDHEETNEIINDIMNSEPVQGNLSLLGHSINEVKTWRGGRKSKYFGKWNAYKYKIQFRTHLSVTKKIRNQSVSETYFENSTGMSPKPVFTQKVSKKSNKTAQIKTPTQKIAENTTSNLKNSTVYCWLCKNFPLSINEVLSVLEVIKSANKSVDKLCQFLENEGIATLLPEGTFPIKLEVPVSLGITAKATFLNFSMLESYNENIFSVPGYERVSRRVGQKTLTSPKKRLFFTNIVA